MGPCRLCADGFCRFGPSQNPLAVYVPKGSPCFSFYFFKFLYFRMRLMHELKIIRILCELPGGLNGAYSEDIQGS